MATYTIGELARRADVGVETIRFYERRGLLCQPEQGEGYRRCPESDLARLGFIRRAKGLGFTLAEIGELLDADGCLSLAVATTGPGPCPSEAR